MRYIKLRTLRKLGSIETLVNVERIVLIQPHTTRQLKPEYEDDPNLSKVPFEDRYEYVPRGTLLVFDGTEEGCVIVQESLEQIKELINV